MAINEHAIDKVATTLNEMLNLICFNYTMNLHSCEMQQIQIEQYVRQLMWAIPNVARLPPQSPVTLRTSVNIENDATLLASMRDLRVAISILFHFLRRFSPDKTFTGAIREWLTKLVACLLRTATCEDHLFLIFHVLRCPAGVADWAVSFIQLPRPNEELSVAPFGCEEIHHCIAYLQALLFPIRSRNEFLAARNKCESSTAANSPIDVANDAVNDDSWIMIDSDGEDDHEQSADVALQLKEKDLIALLNQIPFEKVFGCITFSHLKRDEYVMYWDLISGHHILKFIAFSTNLVQLLGEGLATYDTERYKQFAKMLSRLIRHTVVYLADMHEIFK